MTLSQSLYKSLKHRNSAIEIDVLAPIWSRALLKRMPEVSGIVALDADHGELKLGLRRKLGKRLRQHNYTQAIVLPRSLKSALVPWFASIPKRTGFRGEMRYGFINDRRVLDKNAMPRIVDRFVSLGQTADSALDEFVVPTPKLNVDVHEQQQTLLRLGLQPSQRLLALAPGAAYGKAKRWPVEYFAAVARHYLQHGWTIWIFGTKQDVEAGDAIVANKTVQQSLSSAINLCGKTTLEEAIDLLSLADLTIANDSGLMHIAAAVGSKLVAIYGSGTPLYAPPMSSHSQIVYRGISCSPCWDRTCRYGHYRCLTEITADEVIRNADILLQQ